MESDLERFRSWPRHELELLGKRVSYRKTGQGPAVVFVHGWPLNAATWRHTAAALATEYTCYLPDLPGAGDSPWVPCEMFGGGADVIEAFTDALDLDAYALIGHDSGAAMATQVAARHGARVRALVMGNTEIPGHVPDLVLWLQRATALPGAAQGLRLALGSRTYRRSTAGLGGCFHDPDLLDGEFHQACVEPLLKNVEAAVDALRLADVTGIGDRLAAAHPQIRCPVRFVWGAGDPFFPPEKLPDLRQRIVDAREPLIVQDARLLVHEEHPELFTRECRTALAEAFPELRAVAQA